MSAIKNADWCNIMKKDDVNPNKQVLNRRGSDHSA